jgi:hypothetical protein
MPFPNERTYSFDANLQLSDNAAAYTATGFAQVGGANGILDLQGNQGTSPKQQARIDAVAVCDVTAIKTSSGNETYKLMVLVSNDPAFGAGNVEQAGEIMLGAGAARDGIDMITSVTGRYEIMFSTNIAGSIYEYAALYLVIGGTTPTISIESFLAVLPEM